MKKINKSIITFSHIELQKLEENENSSVEKEMRKLHLTLLPFHITDIESSINEILTSNITKFNKDLHGILLGYKNVKILDSAHAIHNDNCLIHLDIEADFYLFRPSEGKTLIGLVNQVSDDHVGCLVHKAFNVVVPKIEGEEWCGKSLRKGQQILVKVTYTNLEAKLPYIKAYFVSVASDTDSGISTGEENQIDIYHDDINEEILSKKDTIKDEYVSKKRRKDKNISDEVFAEEQSSLIDTESCIKKKKKRSKGNEEQSTFTDTEDTIKTNKHKRRSKENQEQFTFNDNEDIIKTKKHKRRNREDEDQLAISDTEGLTTTKKDKRKSKDKHSSITGGSPKKEDNRMSYNDLEIENILGKYSMTSDITEKQETEDVEQLAFNEIKYDAKTKKRKRSHNEDEEQSAFTGIEEDVIIKRHKKRNKDKINYSIGESFEKEKNKTGHSNLDIDRVLEKHNNVELKYAQSDHDQVKSIEEFSENKQKKSKKRKSKEKQSSDEFDSVDGLPQLGFSETINEKSKSKHKKIKSPLKVDAQNNKQCLPKINVLQNVILTSSQNKELLKDFRSDRDALEFIKQEAFKNALDNIKDKKKKGKLKKNKSDFQETITQENDSSKTFESKEILGISKKERRKSKSKSFSPKSEIMERVMEQTFNDDSDDTPKKTKRKKSKHSSRQEDNINEMKNAILTQALLHISDSDDVRTENKQQKSKITTKTITGEKLSTTLDDVRKSNKSNKKRKNDLEDMKEAVMKAALLNINDSGSDDLNPIGQPDHHKEKKKHRKNDESDKSVKNENSIILYTKELICGNNRDPKTPKQNKNKKKKKHKER